MEGGCGRGTCVPTGSSGLKRSSIGSPRATRLEGTRSSLLRCDYAASARVRAPGTVRTSSSPMGCFRDTVTCLLTAMVLRAAADQGPCPDGYSHQFDGYMSCALAAAPCAKKAVWRPDGVVMADCEKACGGTCEGLSLFGSSECWVYSSWTGNQVFDERSVICRRNAPASAPSPPPPRQRHPPPPPPPRVSSPPPPPSPSPPAEEEEEEQEEEEEAAEEGEVEMAEEPAAPIAPLSSAGIAAATSSTAATPGSGAAASEPLADSAAHGDLAPPVPGAGIGELPLVPLVTLVGGGGVGLLLLLAGCMMLRRRKPRRRGAYYDDDDDDYDDDDDDNEEGGFDEVEERRRRKVGGPAAAGTASQRVLVEVPLRPARHTLSPSLTLAPRVTLLALVLNYAS